MNCCAKQKHTKQIQNYTAVVITQMNWWTFNVPFRQMEQINTERYGQYMQMVEWKMMEGKT